MKKLFVGVLAIAGLVACAQEDVLRTQAPGQIAFAGYTNNAVRAAVDPSATSTSLEEFTVWGWMDNAGGTVLTEERVYGNGVWAYDNVQYWTKNHDYRFVALASNKGNLKGSQTVGYATVADSNTALADIATAVTFTNADGTEDLLYAQATATTVGQTPGKVQFAFDHLLSKVKFQFVNGSTNPNNTIVVKNIRMEVPAQGTITLNAQDGYTWENLANTATLEFGHMENGAQVEDGQTGECDYERLTIPAEAAQTYKVTFDTELWMGTVQATTATKTTVLTGIKLEPGKAYNFKATLTDKNVAEDALLPIEFTATVDEWITATTPDADVVKSEWAAALQLGGNVTLTEDVVLDNSVVLTNDLTLNLNGFTLTAGKSYVAGLTGADISALVVDGGANVTIEGEGTVNGKTYGVYAKDGTLTIKSGNYTAETSAVQVYAATVNIEGGVFSATVTDKRYTINCIDANYRDNSAVVNVYGGKFYQFNPGDNAAEGANTNFLVDGYTTKVEGDYYVVYADQQSIVVAAGETYDGNGATVTALDNRDKGQNGIITPATGGATVKNVTIDGQNGQTISGQTYRGIYLNGVEGTYNVENVTVVNCGYPLHVNTTKAVTLNVKDSFLQGWLSYGATTTATFTNVTFAAGEYANFRPYGDTVLTNCKFENVTLDMYYLGCTDTNPMTYRAATIKFVNCTVNGQPLAETHLQDVPATATVVIE